MRKNILTLAVIALAACLLFSCGSHEPSDLPDGTESAPVDTVETFPIEETTTEAEETAPETAPETAVLGHSELYIPDVSVEDVIIYFNEVCLDAEFVDGGDPTKLQKWETPIKYYCFGAPTDKDMEVLRSFADWLNAIEGFPGMSETDDPDLANLRINFCDQEEFVEFLGENYQGMDGGVTFWYNDLDEIYEAVIGYRTDISQEARNSVILEEIYNGLGPVQDTELRPDSLIYAGYSIPQWLTPVDELILKLLYHPKMKCGMKAAAVEAVIRQLYY